jgi:hypothetical protein
VFCIFRMIISFFDVHLSLYLYRATFGCRVDAIAWGSESSVPSPGKEIRQMFPPFIKLTVPFQVLSQRMVRAISHQNWKPERDSRHIQACSPSAFIADPPFVFLQFLYVSRDDRLLLICAIVQI